MGTLDLARLRDCHNALAAAKAAGWLFVAAVAWFVSWWLIWLIVILVLGPWGLCPSLQNLKWVAWGGLGLLATEGFFYGRKLFDLEEYNRSLYFRIYSGGQETVAPVEARHFGNPLAAAWIISQFFFFAPRATVNIWRSLRGRISLDEETLRRAEDAVAELRGHKGWLSASELTDHPGALYALDRLKVIWSRAENGRVLVRLDPDYE
jgi:hypothetical protein